MIAPLFKTGIIGYGTYLFSAVIIGVLFGIVLEKAGFGNSRKLAGVFYFRDFAVPKVMFMAILTAMVGVYYFSALGIMDPGKLYFSNTHILPFAIGGLIFGVGFVLGGYCPGTAFVALVNKKLDALLFLIGISIGILFYSWIYSSIKSFVKMNDMGKITIPGWLGIHPGWVMLAAILFAFFFFGAANKLESIFGPLEKGEKNEME